MKTNTRSLSPLKWALLLSIAFLLAPEVASADIPFELIRASSSRVMSPSIEVVTSAAQFAEAWNQRLGRRDQVPTVDFQRHSVLIYYAGMKPTTGYSVEVQNLSVQGGTLNVEVLETDPGNCVTGQTSTFPATVVLTIPWKRDAAASLAHHSRQCGGI